MVKYACTVPIFFFKSSVASLNKNEVGFMNVSNAKPYESSSPWLLDEYKPGQIVHTGSF